MPNSLECSIKLEELNKAVEYINENIIRKNPVHKSEQSFLIKVIYTLNAGVFSVIVILINIYLITNFIGFCGTLNDYFDGRMLNIVPIFIIVVISLLFLFGAFSFGGVMAHWGWRSIGSVLFVILSIIEFNFFRRDGKEYRKLKRNK